MKKDFSTILTNEKEEDDLANEIISFIQECENSIQVNLDKLFDDLSDQYIKPLRRKLPSNLNFIKFLVNGCKMNWNLAQQTLLK